MHLFQRSHIHMYLFQYSSIHMHLLQLFSFIVGAQRPDAQGVGGHRLGQPLWLECPQVGSPGRHVYVICRLSATPCKTLQCPATLNTFLQVGSRACLLGFEVIRMSICRPRNTRKGVSSSGVSQECNYKWRFQTVMSM